MPFMLQGANTITVRECCSGCCGVPSQFSGPLPVVHSTGSPQTQKATKATSERSHLEPQHRGETYTDSYLKNGALLSGTNRVAPFVVAAKLPLRADRSVRGSFFRYSLSKLNQKHIHRFIAHLIVFVLFGFFYHEKHENEGIHMNIFSFVFQGNMDICSKTFKTGQHFICQSSQKRSVSSGCSRTCFWNGVCSGNPFVQEISMKHEHYWLWLNVGPKMVLRASGLQQKQPHSICLQHPICFAIWHKSPVVLLAPSIRSPQTQNCNQKMIKTKY